MCRDQAGGGGGRRVGHTGAPSPREWQSADSRPGIVHLLKEISDLDLDPAHVVIVYHPCYEAFVAWATRS